jgi:AcrR family transcriptional regulator
VTRSGSSSDRGSATLELVLATSTDLFAERGYTAATMRELADRAAVPLSTFYYYFRRKYDVLLGIMDTVMSELEAGAEAAHDESLLAPEQLVALVEAHVRVHLEHPAAARVADGELRALLPADLEPMVARRDAYEDRFREVLRAGIARGDFAEDLDVQIASMAILTMSTGVVNWWRPEGRYTVADTARIFGRLALGVAQCDRAPLGAGGLSGSPARRISTTS